MSSTKALPARSNISDSRPRTYLRAANFFLAFLLVTVPSLALASSAPPSAATPPVWTTAFFILMLLAIAILPLTKLAHAWEHNRNKLSLSLALSAYPLYYLLLEIRAHATLLATLHEYTSFIILLGTLFYTTSGILLKGDLKATPLINTTFLAIGTLLASFVGTTGASMLLIRPILRTNAERDKKVHVIVFFIFLVSNIGGSLLPIGDPPLFLGYLQGVPFLWTLHLWPHMLTAVVILLAAFYFLDRRLYRRESRQALLKDATHIEPLRVAGKLNFLWLLAIVLCVALIRDEDTFIFARELAMIACAVASKLTTKPEVRRDNRFTWFPILEVAALFIGIFITMIPALMLLKAQGASLGIDSPAKFFWISGALSSFLDNAPTYLVFYNTAQGMVSQGLFAGWPLVESVGIPFSVLLAISAGSVFMGANTYIGNGPNFMVKAIAEEQGVKMPSFFGYMRWSGLILLPTFGLLTLLYFR